MRDKLFVLIAGVLIVLALAGCSKSDSSPTAVATTSTAPTFPSTTFTGPTTSSTDANAAITSSYAASVNAYASSSLFGIFAGTNATQSGNSWSWTYTVQTFTITFSMTKQTDGSYSWKWVENGTDPDNHRVYNNWTVYEGTRSADGKSGEWKIYADTSTHLSADFVWVTTGTGSTSKLTGTLTAYDTNSAVTEKLVVTNNGDKTGEVDLYNGTVVVYKAIWAANGSGQWWAYNSTGTQTGTGTWS